MSNDERPGVEETYSSAITSSNLRCEAERRGDADMLIAAGWSPSRIGAALMRLHTEYDSGQKYKGVLSSTDQFLLINRLKSLPDVRRELTARTADERVERPDETTLAVLAWWVDPVCRCCSGRKFEVVLDTPALSGKKCKSCQGSGEMHRPYGDTGKRLALFMDDCVNRARQSIKKHLRSSQ